jgi:intein/homing endonuclease
MTKRCITLRPQLKFYLGEKMIRLNEDDFVKRDLVIKEGKLNSREIAEIFKCNARVVAKRAWHLGVKLPYASPLSRFKYKYKVDHNFFKTWTIGMAYVLGFIAADGNIFKEKNRPNVWKLKIGLSAKDVCHLEKIKIVMGSTHPIKIRNTNYKTKKGDMLMKACLNINSKSICDDLFDLGVTERKSLTLQWIDQCPAEYVSHLVRGYFDGDGCINIYNLERKSASIRATMLGTEHFLNGVAENVGINRIPIPIKNKCIYDLRYHGKQCVQFLDWLYKDSYDLVRLDRKYNKYINYIA